MHDDDSLPHSAIPPIDHELLRVSKAKAEALKQHEDLEEARRNYGGLEEARRQAMGEGASALEHYERIEDARRQAMSEIAKIEIPRLDPPSIANFESEPAKLHRVLRELEGRQAEREAAMERARQGREDAIEDARQDREEETLRIAGEALKRSKAADRRSEKTMRVTLVIAIAAITTAVFAVLNFLSR